MPDLPLDRFRATIHYDGTGFRGWQLQPEQRTVQREVERALSRLLDTRTGVLAAGRTDTGVHAVGQEIAFDAAGCWVAADLRRGLNALLPDDVWVERLESAAPGFHPRYDAVGRRYEYLLSDDPEGGSPILGARIWNLGAQRALDEDRLTAISTQILGEHSFTALSKSGQPERGTRCHVKSAVWDRPLPELLHFTIVADRFLHRMVRYLVATIVEVGVGRREAIELGQLLQPASEPALASVDEPRPPIPAPACGLYLTGVRYADGWNRAPGIPGIAKPDRTEGVRGDRIDGSDA